MRREWWELHKITGTPFTKWVSLSSFMGHIVLLQHTGLHACYHSLFFFARYSNVYVVYCYFPPWLLLNSPFPVCWHSQLSKTNKISKFYLEIRFQPVVRALFPHFIWYTYPKKLYLGLCFSYKSLYRHNQEKKLKYWFFRYIFPLQEEKILKYTPWQNIESGLTKNILKLIFQMTTPPRRNLEDLNMHFPHARFLSSWLILGLSLLLFTSFFPFKNKQTF